MDLMVELLQWSFTKLPKHWKVVSHWQDDQECNAEFDCWKVLKLAISGKGVVRLEGVVMTMPAGGVSKEPRFHASWIAKNEGKNNLVVSHLTCNSSESGTGN